jgi:hypothetical protein
MIIVYYTSVDGCRKTEVCKDLQHAREWAHYWVGEHPEMGSRYAISGDGVGKITCSGCKLSELFPEEN